MQPQRRQPTGSPAPGILQARTLEWVAISFSSAWKWKWSCSDSSQPHGLQPTRLLRPWDFPGKSTGVGCIAFSDTLLDPYLKVLLFVLSSSLSVPALIWNCPNYHSSEINLSFSGGSVAKNLPANAGDSGLIPGSGKSPGEGNGNALQYSWLGNPMDGGAWKAIVHGVEKCQIPLSDWTTTINLDIWQWSPHLFQFH